MPKKQRKKIGWAPKRIFWVAIVIFIATVGVFLTKPHGDSIYKKIEIGGDILQVEVADEPREQQTGLSNRNVLAEDTGMLFVFEQSSNHCFWMKDTRFALDIIWLNDNKTITAIEENVVPETYPYTYCHDGRYVLEVNGGYVAKTSVEPGQVVDFKLE